MGAYFISVVYIVVCKALMTVTFGKSICRLSIPSGTSVKWNSPRSFALTEPMRSPSCRRCKRASLIKPLLPRGRICPSKSRRSSSVEMRMWMSNSSACKTTWRKRKGPSATTARAPATAGWAKLSNMIEATICRKNGRNSGVLRVWNICLPEASTAAGAFRRCTRLTHPASVDQPCNSTAHSLHDSICVFQNRCSANAIVPSTRSKAVSELKCMSSLSSAGKVGQSVGKNTPAAKILANS